MLTTGQRGRTVTGMNAQAIQPHTPKPLTTAQVNALSDARSYWDDRLNCPEVTDLGEWQIEEGLMHPTAHIDFKFNGQAATAYYYTYGYSQPRAYYEKWPSMTCRAICPV